MAAQRRDGMDEAASELDEVRELARARASVPGALLPILHAVQARYGHVPPGAVAVIADVLNLTRAEVHGVVSFYHDFRDRKPGRHVVQLCRAEACQSLGGRAVEQRLKQLLGIEFGDTTRDGAVTLEPVYCLGHCAAAPALTVDGAPVGRVDPAGCDRLIERLRGGA
jgi:formate dehydrogenase subunit gamma